MAYAVRFQSAYTNASGDGVTVSLLEDGHAGGITTFRAGKRPAVIQHGPSGQGGAEHGVKAAMLSLSVHASSLFVVEAIYDDPASLWRVEKKIGARLVFSGVLVKDEPTEGTDFFPKSATLRAACGLGLLEGVPLAATVEDAEALLAAEGKRLTEWLALALGETGAGLPFEVCTAYGDATTVSPEDPFASAFAAPSKWVRIVDHVSDDGETNEQRVESASMLQVLEDLCSSQQAVLVQHPHLDGLRWRFVSRERFYETAAPSWFVYDAAGDYDDAYAALASVEIAEVGGATYGARLKGGTRTHRKGGPVARVDYAHGEGRSVLPAIGGAGDAFGAWGVTGVGVGTHRYIEPPDDGTGVSDSLYFSFPAKHGAEDPTAVYANPEAGAAVLEGTRLVFGFAAYVIPTAAGRRAQNPRPIQLRYRVVAQAAVTTHYLITDSDGLPAWTSDPVEAGIGAPIAFLPVATEKYHLPTAELPPLPEDADVTAYVFAAYDPSPPLTGSNLVNTVHVGQIYLAPLTGDGAATSYAATVTGEATKAPHGGYALALGSGPTALHDGGLRDSAGAPLVRWWFYPPDGHPSDADVSDGAPLQETLALRLLGQYRREGAEVQGVYRMKGVDPAAVPSPGVALVEGDGRVYAVTSSEYDDSIFAGSVRVTAREVRRDGFTATIGRLFDDQAGVLGGVGGGSGDALARILQAGADSTDLRGAMAFAVTTADYDPEAESGGDPLPIEITEVEEAHELLRAGKGIAIHGVFGGVWTFTLAGRVAEGAEEIVREASYGAPASGGLIPAGSYVYATGETVLAATAINRRAITNTVRGLGEVGRLGADYDGTPVSSLTLGAPGLLEAVKAGQMLAHVREDDGDQTVFYVTADTAAAATTLGIDDGDGTTPVAITGASGESLVVPGQQRQSEYVQTASEIALQATRIEARTGRLGTLTSALTTGAGQTSVPVTLDKAATFNTGDAFGLTLSTGARLSFTATGAAQVFAAGAVTVAVAAFTPAVAVDAGTEVTLVDNELQASNTTRASEIALRVEKNGLVSELTIQFDNIDFNTGYIKSSTWDGTVDATTPSAVTIATPGTVGWVITNSGQAEFNDVESRGSFRTSGSSGGVDRDGVLQAGFLTVSEADGADEWDATLVGGGLNFNSAVGGVAAAASLTPGRILVSHNGDTFEANAVTGVFEWNGFSVWHAANDGTGSGLDADLLDGQEGAYYRDASNLNAGTVADARLPADLLKDCVYNAGSNTLTVWLGGVEYTITGVTPA